MMFYVIWTLISIVTESKSLLNNIVSNEVKLTEENAPLYLAGDSFAFSKNFKLVDNNIFRYRHLSIAILRFVALKPLLSTQ